MLHNVQGPRRDLILARLEGGPLAETGVAQGMSGSPVYIDGRLVGAVSYSIGAFSKEPIAGITPIAEMKDATAVARRTVQAEARLELPSRRRACQRHSPPYTTASHRLRSVRPTSSDRNALRSRISAGRVAASHRYTLDARWLRTGSRGSHRRAVPRRRLQSDHHRRRRGDRASRQQSPT